MLKFNKDLSPPDVGKEEGDPFDSENVDDNPFSFSNEESNEKISRSKKGKKQENTEKVSLDPIESLETPSKNTLSIEKISAKMEVFNSLINALNERFSLVNQQLGEVRAATVANEKNLSLSNLDAKKVIELVKELNPGKLSENYQKIESKVENLSEKLDSYSQLLNALTEDIKSIKRKANLFEGSEALLKLQGDVKKDLIEIQKVNTKVRMNADKSEQIFVELSKRSAQDQELKEKLANLDSSFAALSKDFQKIRLNKNKLTSIVDFNEFKRITNFNLSAIQKNLLDLENLSNKSDKLANSIEKIIGMEKKNEEDIALISKKKYDNIEKQIKDYEKKMASTLSILEKMAGEINKIKKNKKPLIVPNKEPPSNQKLEQLKENSLFKNAQTTEKPELKKSIFGFNKEVKPKESSDLEKKQDEPASNNSFPSGVNSEKDQIPTLKDPLSESETQIEKLVQEGELSLLNNNVPAAVENYQKILDLYNPTRDNDLDLYHKIINFYNNLFILLSKSPDFTNPDSLQEELAPPMKFKKLSDY